MIIKNNNININHLNLKPTNKTTNKTNTEPANSFKDILSKSINKENEVKFSKHASIRLEQRDIKLSKAQSEKLNESVEMLRQKGSKESLVMLDEIAFIVNVKNNTVVTALNGEEAEDNVFTNIDAAMISKT